MITKRQAKKRVDEFVWEGRPKWKTTTTIHFDRLKTLIFETVDISDISEVSQSGDVTDHHCANLYRGRDEMQYYIAKKLLEHNMIFYVESLFGVKSRDTFVNGLVYRSGVSSETAILIDQSGKTKISLPMDLLVLHNKEAQKELINELNKFKLVQRLIENPLEASVWLGVVKKLNIISDISYAEEALSSVRIYGDNSFYEDFSNRIMNNIIFMESLDQILADFGIDESRRGDIWKSFKNIIKEDGDLLVSSQRNPFLNKTIRDGLVMIGLSDEELNFFSTNTLLDDFFELQYLGNKYKSPYQKNSDFQHYYHSPKESDITIRDEIFEFCKKTNDVEYALRHSGIPTQLSVAKSCMELGIDEEGIVRDTMAVVPELKGMLRPRDLMYLDCSGVVFTPRGERGWFCESNKEYRMQNIYQLVSLLISAGCIISDLQPVLTPKFFEFDEKLDFTTTGGDKAKGEIYIPNDLKRAIIDKVGAQIDWEKTKPEQISRVDVGLRHIMAHNSLKRLLELMDRKDIWSAIEELQVNSFRINNGDVFRLAEELSKSKPNDKFLSYLMSNRRK
jgi:hypothetical protein